mmetsp:Transcript_5920/g.17761  ORF Transcript_5920/g.17761 Transcript_5920/m.17761 type:complete len:253 (-) Transcript_5920:1347-2105(-)
MMRLACHSMMMRTTSPMLPFRILTFAMSWNVGRRRTASSLTSCEWIGASCFEVLENDDEEWPQWKMRLWMQLSTSVLLGDAARLFLCWCAAIYDRATDWDRDLRRRRGPGNAAPVGACFASSCRATSAVSVCETVSGSPDRMLTCPLSAFRSSSMACWATMSSCAGPSACARDGCLCRCGYGCHPPRTRCHGRWLERLFGFPRRHDLLPPSGLVLQHPGKTWSQSIVDGRHASCCRVAVPLRFGFANHGDGA